MMFGKVCVDVSDWGFLWCACFITSCGTVGGTNVGVTLLHVLTRFFVNSARILIGAVKLVA